MKPVNIIAALALVPALVSLGADPASAARRKPSKDAVINSAPAEETQNTSAQAAPSAAPNGATPAQAAPAAAPNSAQAQPPAVAPVMEQATPYSASSAVLAPSAEKPAIQTPIKQGRIEAGGSLTYAWTNKLTDTMTLRGRAGIFYTRELSLGASFTTNMGGRDNINAFFFEPQYHFFVDPKLVPFLSGKIGFGRLGDGDDNHFSSFALGVGGGVKYFHRDDAYFYAQFDDVRYFSDGGIASLALGVGMAKFF